MTLTREVPYSHDHTVHDFLCTITTKLAPMWRDSFDKLIQKHDYLRAQTIIRNDISDKERQFCAACIESSNSTESDEQFGKQAREHLQPLATLQKLNDELSRLMDVSTAVAAQRYEAYLREGAG